MLQQTWSNFVWKDAPLSSPAAPITGAILYLSIVYFLMKRKKYSQPLNLRFVAVIHDLVMSVVSLIMFCGMWYEMFNRGLGLWVFCENPDGEDPGHPNLYRWTYIFYLTKYWEMLDTVLVLLQHSRVPHLNFQIYHHAVTMPLTYLWCESGQSLQHLGGQFNAGVHVIMYHYYAWRLLRLPTPWKKYITKIQVAQFVFSFAVLNITLYLHFFTDQVCRGMHSLFWNCAVNVTMLYFFVGLLGGSKRSVKSRKRASSGGVETCTSGGGAAALDSGVTESKGGVGGGGSDVAKSAATVRKNNNDVDE